MRSIDRIRQRLEALAVRMPLTLFRRLGPAQASDLGGWLCSAIGPLLPVSRVADTNLRLVMPEPDRAARRCVVRGIRDNPGRTMAEFPHLAGRRKDTPTGPGWTAQGAEVLFMSGHIGNWEMLPAAVAHFGRHFSSFHRAAGNPLLDAMIRDLRTVAMATEVPLFAKGARGARGALAHVLRGGSLGMLVDQKMNDEIEAMLFGQPAMTATALAAIALRQRCPVIP